MNEVKSVFSKKGFTLVELLAVIIILGIILVLAVPRVSDMINKYRDKAYERQLDLILNAAEQYSIFYEDEINWLGDYASITLKELQEKGLIASPTKNPKGGEFDSENFTIILTRLANGLIKYSINIEGHYTAQELQDMIDQGYITVATASELNDIKDDLNGKYVQVADIDLSGYANWVPIGEVTMEQIVSGDDSTIFKGTFDGNNYAISNLTINRPDDDFQGLFGAVLLGDLKNIKIINANVKGSVGVGALVGGAGLSTITNCSSTGTIWGNEQVGGLIGIDGVADLDILGSDIENCYSKCNVEAEYRTAGGLIGGKYEGNIINSYATGGVVGFSYIGGLVGSNQGNINGCYATGTVEGDDYVGGLVGENQGNINGCYATGTVEGDDYVGGLVGENYDGQITNCYATGYIAGYGDVGGLVGYNNNGQITNSYATGDIDADAATATGGLVGYNNSQITNSYATGFVIGRYEVGGLVGSNQGNINGCYATGNVAGLDNYVGGLVGSNQGNINGCYTTGTVEGDDYVGGLVGENYDGQITNCYATGYIAGYGDVGGLVGYNNNGQITNSYATGDIDADAATATGGLVGYNNNGQITNSYATGFVIGRYEVGGLVGDNYGIIRNCYATGYIVGYGNVGGLVGYNYGSEANNSYWDTDTSGQSISAGGEGKTTVQMKQQITYVDWDFTDIWNIDEGVSYPYFR